MYIFTNPPSLIPPSLHPPTFTFATNWIDCGATFHCFSPLLPPYFNLLFAIVGFIYPVFLDQNPVRDVWIKTCTGTKRRNENQFIEAGFSLFIHIAHYQLGNRGKQAFMARGKHTLGRDFKCARTVGRLLLISTCFCFGRLRLLGGKELLKRKETDK